MMSGFDHVTNWRPEFRAHQYKDGTNGTWSVVGDSADVTGQPMTVLLADWLDEETARFIAEAPKMYEVLKALDTDWTEAYPDGPEGDYGLIALRESTVDIWRKARSAIAKATT